MQAAMLVSDMSRSALNVGWTKSPGVKMERQEKEHVITIEAQSIEFVLNNGRDEWDQPFPLDEKRRNYKIKESGSFLLRHGSIQRRI